MKNFNFLLEPRCILHRLLAAVLLLPTLQLRSQDYWEQVAQLPNGRFLSSAERVGDKIYIMGGILPNALTTTEVYTFDPATKLFQIRKPLAKPLAAMASAVYGDTIYVFGGIPMSQGQPSQKCYKYVPALNEWFELPDLPTQPRGYAVAEVLNDKIYVIGGIEKNSVATYSLVEAFDPLTGKWSTEPVAQMPTPRGYMGSAVMNGRIYVFGGGTPAPAYYGLSTVESFDGENWVQEDSMPTHRYGAAAGVIGDSIIYVSGGVLSGWLDINVTEGFSEAAGWQTFAPLPVNMHAHAVVKFGEVLYAFGGVAGPTVYKSVLVYHPTLVNSHDIPLGISRLSVFPNPASGRVNFLFEKPASGQLTLTRPDGAVVFSKNFKNENRLEVPVSGLPDGVFFWKFLDENGDSAAGKLLIAN